MASYFMFFSYFSYSINVVCMQLTKKLVFFFSFLFGSKFTSGGIMRVFGVSSLLLSNFETKSAQYSLNSMQVT